MELDEVLACADALVCGEVGNERKEILAKVGDFGRSDVGEDGPRADGPLEEFPGDAIDLCRGKLM